MTTTAPSATSSPTGWRRRLFQVLFIGVIAAASLLCGYATLLLNRHTDAEAAAILAGSNGLSTVMLAIGLTQAVKDRRN